MCKLKLNKLSCLFLTGTSLFLTAPVFADYEYSKSHNFKIPTTLYDKPINEITFPGSHNSFNRSGYDRRGCANSNPFLSSNKNVHRSISDQIEFGMRFLELDVYKANGNWCLFHGGGGISALDGNSYFLSDIIDQISDGLNKIGKEIIFIKMDGYKHHEDPELFSERENFLKQELKRVGLEDAVYVRDGEDTPPTLNELAEAGKRLIFVSGTKEHYPWGWNNAGTSPKHTQRNGPLANTINNPNGAAFIRWNAFALDDAVGWGSTSDADYLHARLIGHGIQKWAQAAHRISHLIVDFPSRQSVGMSAMRAANIFNQVPSAYGVIKDENGQTLKDVKYIYRVENANLADDQGWYRWDGYHNQAIVAEHAHGKFDFPMPHGQSISIQPSKEGYRFEPESIYLNAEEEHQPTEVSFKAIKM